MDTKNRLVFHQSCGDGEVNEMGKGDPNLQTLSYKINESWRCNIEYGDYAQQYSIVYLKVAVRVNLRSSHHKK